MIQSNVPAFVILVTYWCNIINDPVWDQIDKSYYDSIYSTSIELMNHILNMKIQFIKVSKY